MKLFKSARLVSVAATALIAWLPASQAHAAGSWVAVDKAASAGLSYTGESWIATPVDTNGDGRQDIWIGHHDQGAVLMQNNGNGTYTQVAADAWPKKNPDGLIPDRHDCVFADFDHNGLPDAYCAAGRGTANVVKTGKANQVWLQTSVNNFQEVSDQWGGQDLCGRSHHATVIDANGDGWPDVFVGNAPSRGETGDPCNQAGNPYGNNYSKLFINNHGTGFIDETDQFGMGGTNTGAPCAQTVDFNNDGLPDIMACSDSGIALWQNNGNQGFANVASSLGLMHNNCRDAEMGDLNKDGWQDFVCITGTAVTYQLGSASGFGAIKTAYHIADGYGHALALGDADGNGQLDIYVLESNTTGGPNPNDEILLNQNLNFSTVVPVPSAGGLGDSVAAVHEYPKSTKDEFVVLNGGNNVPGPLQFIVLKRPTTL